MWDNSLPGHLAPSISIYELIQSNNPDAAKKTKKISTDKLNSEGKYIA